MLLLDASAAEQPFFLMAPAWGLLPLVGLATAAAIIASQALISGAFSLTQQAVQLGYSPRLDIDHTSSHHMGQIYVPQVNWALMVGTIAIVLGFRSSSALAAAYGIAVTLTMVITTLLLHAVATERWKWPVGVTALVTGTFLAIDLAFFGANLLKILHGGWLPLVIGGVLFTLMTTWKTGRRLVAERLIQRAVPLEQFVAGGAGATPDPGAGHGGVHDGAGAGHAGRAGSQSAAQQGPARTGHHSDRADDADPACRAGGSTHRAGDGQGSLQRGTPLRLHGRTECTRRADSLPPEKGLPSSADVTYFLGRETVIVTKTPGMAMWRERLFVLMAKNAVRATAFFKLPPDSVVELGVQVEI